MFFLAWGEEANEHWYHWWAEILWTGLGGLLVLALLTNVRVSVDGTSNATVSSPGLGIPAHRKTLLTEDAESQHRRRLPRSFLSKYTDFLVSIFADYGIFHIGMAVTFGYFWHLGPNLGLLESIFWSVSFGDLRDLTCVEGSLTFQVQWCAVAPPCLVQKVSSNLNRSDLMSRGKPNQVQYLIRLATWRFHLCGVGDI